MNSDGLDDNMQWLVNSFIDIPRKWSGQGRVIHNPLSKEKNVMLVSGDTIYGADVVLMAAGNTPNTMGLISDELVYNGNIEGFWLVPCGTCCCGLGRHGHEMHLCFGRCMCQDRADAHDYSLIGPLDALSAQTIKN
jgi:hypothetical protein